MALLLSEICRLILGFLEEELLVKTYESFLEECKYLEECKAYLNKGFVFPKTIHGKTLKQYLLYDYQKKYLNAETQTESLMHQENTTQTEEVLVLNASPRKEPSQLQAWQNSTGKVSSITITPAHLFNENSTESFASISTISEQQIGKTASKRKPLKRKNSLIYTPKKHQVVDSECSGTYYLGEPMDEEGILDIESFIKHLCENDFPAKLAQSVNELQAKKLNASSIQHEESIVMDQETTSQQANGKESPLVQQIFPIETSNNQTASLLNQNTTTTTTEITNEAPDDTENGKIVIANEDISLLAEHFSEPAFATLFEVVNSGAKELNSSLLDTEPIDLDLNQDLEPSEEDQAVTSTQIKQTAKSQIETMPNGVIKTNSIFDRTNIAKRILPAVSKSNEDPNPYLVLKNIFQETETSKKKKQPKQERNASKKLGPSSNSSKQETQINSKLDCLASAAPILLTPDAKNQEKETFKPYKSPMMDTSIVNSPRRSKTIRQIIEIDKDEVNNQNEIAEIEGSRTIQVADVNSSDNLTKIVSTQKRNSKSKLQKSDYFDDFFEKIKDLEKKD